MGYQRRVHGDSFLACQTRKMFRLAVLFCCAAFAAAEAEAEADPYYGYGYGLGGYSGLGYSRGYYGKREAEAEPKADADAEADPYYGYGYSGLGYGRGYGYSGLGYSRGY